MLNEDYVMINELINSRRILDNSLTSMLEKKNKHQSNKKKD